MERKARAAMVSCDEARLAPVVSSDASLRMVLAVKQAGTDSGAAAERPGERSKRHVEKTTGVARCCWSKVAHQMMVEEHGVRPVRVTLVTKTRLLRLK